MISPSRADSKRARREASRIKEREEEVKNLLSVYIVVFSRENAVVESKKENNKKEKTNRLLKVIEERERERFTSKWGVAVVRVAVVVVAAVVRVGM